MGWQTWPVTFLSGVGMYKVGRAVRRLRIREDLIQVHLGSIGVVVGATMPALPDVRYDTTGVLREG